MKKNIPLIITVIMNICFMVIFFVAAKVTYTFPSTPLWVKLITIPLWFTCIWVCVIMWDNFVETYK